MGCRRKNTLCLSLDFGANDGTLLPRLTRLETSPSPQKRLVLKFPITRVAAGSSRSGRKGRKRSFRFSVYIFIVVITKVQLTERIVIILQV